MICGDFNTQNELWGSSQSNFNGRSLAGSISELGSNLVFLNTGFPTRVSSNSDLVSVPDLTLASPDLSYLCFWFTLNEPLGSDYLPIQINIGIMIDPSSNWDVNIKDLNYSINILTRIYLFRFVMNIFRIIHALQ